MRIVYGVRDEKTEKRILQSVGFRFLSSVSIAAFEFKKQTNAMSAKKKKNVESDASSIQYEMMRLDDLGTQDIAFENLKKLADEFRGQRS